MRWLALILCLIASPVWASTYEVSNNPYRDVNWSTDVRCRGQFHDHVKSVDRIESYDDAGYCTITWMDYAGWYTVPDGVLTGFGYPRRWPAEDLGATDPSSLTNIKFYTPGAEEVGFESDAGAYTSHFHSTFMTTYIESLPCGSCGTGGIQLPTSANPVPPSLRYFTDQELIDLIKAEGGMPILNHPSIGDGQDETGWEAVEIINTFMVLRDSADAGTRRVDAIALWDTVLEERSARICGVGVNDNFGPYRESEVPITGGGGGVPDPVTLDMINQSGIEAMVATKTLVDYEAAVRKCAFFTFWEDETVSTKGTYPLVTDITITTGAISITTDAGDETVTWIANGSTVGTGFAFDLESLGAGMKYIRAEIDDGSGGILYIQPFELSHPIGSSGRSFGSSIR